MSDDFIGKRFGKYLLLDHLVDGGMAKICRARSLGENIARVVAIKMVHPKYTKDESFKTMFMDEIRVSYGLIHPNIVQIYDYGVNNDQLFVALEYCDGKNLKEFLDKLKEKKYVFPVEISVHIATQICQGLHHAHTFIDKLTGKRANIVHRDISPHNIMVSYDGSIKVIDFGIAKAETNSEETQAGTIKGKLSYLAPEYLEGMELDHRYDQFAVGITLWELLCNRKLFSAKNDLAVLKKIQECKIPVPSSINPNVPKELDDIIMKALSINRDDRYKNMDAFSRVLIKFLYANYPDFNASDLSYFSKDLFKEEIIIDRNKLFEFGKVDVSHFVKEWENEQKRGNLNQSKEVVSNSTKTKDFDFDFDEESITISKSSVPDNKSEKKQGFKKKTDQIYHLDIDSSIKTSGGIKIGQPLKGKKVAQNKRVSKNKRKRDVEEFTRTSILQVPKTKIPWVAMLCLGVGAWLGKDFILKYISPQSQKVNSLSQLPSEEKNLDETKNNSRKVASNDGRIQMHEIQFVDFNNFSHKVYVNNKKVKPDILGKIKLKSGRDYSIRIEQSGRLPKVFKVTKFNKYKKIVIPRLQAAEFAHLFMSNKCIAGSLEYKLYGEKRIAILPLSKKNIISFPTSPKGRRVANEENLATYNLYYQSVSSSVLKKIKLEIIADKFDYDLCEILE